MGASGLLQRLELEDRLLLLRWGLAGAESVDVREMALASAQLLVETRVEMWVETQVPDALPIADR